jgi:hypothetical protein
MAVELNCWTEHTLNKAMNSICVSGWRNEYTAMACTTPILSANWGARASACPREATQSDRDAWIHRLVKLHASLGRSPVMSKLEMLLPSLCLPVLLVPVHLFSTVLVPAACVLYCAAAEPSRAYHWLDLEIIKMWSRQSHASKREHVWITTLLALSPKACVNYDIVTDYQLRVFLWYFWIPGNKLRFPLISVINKLIFFISNLY